MARYVNNSNATWAANVERLRDTFDRWGIGFEHFNIECQHADTYGKNNRPGWVRVQYRHPGSGRMVTMELDEQRTARQNLNAIVLTVDGLRLQEVRGLGDLAAAHYLALAAPAATRDPYEVLGVRPDAPLDVIDAAYKAASKRVHPDVNGGSDARMAELNAARDAVRLERGE